MAATHYARLAGQLEGALLSKDADRREAAFVFILPELVQEDPQIVVAVMLWEGEHGYAAARIASQVISHYLKRPAIVPANVEGD